jgi:hypothetical protein
MMVDCCKGRLVRYCKNGMHSKILCVPPTSELVMSRQLEQVLTLLKKMEEGEGTLNNTHQN